MRKLDQDAPQEPCGVFAHSLQGRPQGEWEPLRSHLQAVGEGSSQRASAFGWAEAARAAGLLHDVGKMSAAFQTYIGARGDAIAERAGSVDHSTAGAREALALYGDKLGKLLAYGIAGHHAGLADAEDLQRRLDGQAYAIPDYGGWQAEAGPLPSAEGLMGPLNRGAPRGFAETFLARMLFSCLVDADFIETERFYAGSRGETIDREGFTPINDLADRLQTHLQTIRSDETAVNRLRAQVLDHATARARLEPGLFTLTVPTGGGKTLTSLSFALEHARRHGLRRVIYVIPFTSIIEQTADVFRKALGSNIDVLEHHANFDWEAVLPREVSAAAADAGEGPDGLAKLRRAAENWQAPVVVTTAVQFFESLFANRTSRCRKLHNMAGAVIVLDEAQTLPLNLLQPCLAAIGELARNYRSSLVLCTATQPAIRCDDGFDGGLEIGRDRELAPNPNKLYRQLKRVTLQHLAGRTHDATIVARFGEQPRMLCIVNSRAHARQLFGQIESMEGATHLTTLMCPRHRRMVLADVRDRLRAGAPVRLVATSLIEAGVDVDFPEVWRALAGLDQIAQAAGRCNREGAPTPGRVIVFEPAEAQAPAALRPLISAAEGVLRRREDPLTLDALKEYFLQLYWHKGPDAFDDAMLDGRRFPILTRIRQRRSELDFPFESIARAFRLIDQAMEPVIVPWKRSDEDRDAELLLGRIAACDRISRADLRRLQQYAVPLPSKLRADWLAHGVLRPVHPQLNTAILAFANLDLYDAASGIRVDDPTYRHAESNIL